MGTATQVKNSIVAEAQVLAGQQLLRMQLAACQQC